MANKMRSYGEKRRFECLSLYQISHPMRDCWLSTIGKAARAYQQFSITTAAPVCVRARASIHRSQANTEYTKSNFVHVCLRKRSYCKILEAPIYWHLISMSISLILLGYLSFLLDVDCICESGWSFRMFLLTAGCMRAIVHLYRFVCDRFPFIYYEIVSSYNYFGVYYLFRRSKRGIQITHYR